MNDWRLLCIEMPNLISKNNSINKRLGCAVFESGSGLKRWNRFATRFAHTQTLVGMMSVTSDRALDTFHRPESALQCFKEMIDSSHLQILGHVQQQQHRLQSFQS